MVMSPAIQVERGSSWLGSWSFEMAWQLSDFSRKIADRGIDAGRVNIFIFATHE